ncbi:MAG: hypothetical protein ACREJ6_15955 [Candidatus Methylomirabilis sp.]
MRASTGVLEAVSHPLRTGVPRVLGFHGGKLGHRFHAHVLALMARCGPFDGLAKAQAAATARFWVDWQSLSEELTTAEAQRTNGAGRRPSARQVQALRKRLALGWKSYEGALKRLEELQGVKR